MKALFVFLSTAGHSNIDKQGELLHNAVIKCKLACVIIRSRASVHIAYGAGTYVNGFDKNWWKNGRE